MSVDHATVRKIASLARIAVTDDQVEAMVSALNHGPVLAFCRSGTRSCNLWALAAAKQGGDPAEIIAAAGEGGYNVAGLLPMLKQLAPR